ncbi:MAG TPA: MurR/RpiR family transcriptional regulator [Clostridiaceae bacterium]|nr:MurR/RpiR family transcriptional regulator [Clostridiaceae bacterium]
MTKNIEVSKYYSQFTKSEKIIADYIEKDPGTIGEMTLSDLSTLLNVGEATIIRFCRKIGFKGFQDFKFAVAVAEVNNDNTSNVLSFQDNIENNIVRTIQNTKNNINDDILYKAISMINNTANIFLYGVGFSGYIAKIAEGRFLRVGKRTKAVCDPHFQCMQSSISNENDLIIGISLSGTTKDIIESLTIAREANAKIIVVTSNKQSKLTKLADCVLLTAKKENPLLGGSFSGMMSQMFALDMLCTGYALLNQKNSIKYMEKTAKSIMMKS